MLLKFLLNLKKCIEETQTDYYKQIILSTIKVTFIIILCS